MGSSAVLRGLEVILWGSLTSFVVLGGAFAGLCQGPWEILGAPWGRRGESLESTFGKQAALQNNFFYCINGYSVALRGGLGGPWVGEMKAKTGGEELIGDRGAH